MTKIEVFEDGKKVDEDRIKVLGVETYVVGDPERLVLQMPKRRLTDQEINEVKEELQKFGSGEARFLLLPWGWKLVAALGKVKP